MDSGASKAAMVRQQREGTSGVPDGPLLSAVLESGLVPLWNLRDEPTGPTQAFVSPDRFAFLYFARPASPFLASQTAGFGSWNYSTFNPYWTWPKSGPLPVLEGLAHFTEAARGPPGHIHGGAVATVLDSMATVVSNSIFCRMNMAEPGQQLQKKPGGPAFEHPGYRTVSLSVSYRKGLPSPSTTFFRVVMVGCEDGRGKDGKVQLRRKITLRGGLYDRVLEENETDESARSAAYAELDCVFVLGGPVLDRVLEECWRRMEGREAPRL
ncbi:hypothetical protein DFJ74DRAFT_307862 [Hyaloraphidium curvatum]|nr:hypothetical protein DFJ74DRAFT_307862 [Hyaloraphidium curvatum]